MLFFSLGLVNQHQHNTEVSSTFLVFNTFWAWNHRVRCSLSILLLMFLLLFISRHFMVAGMLFRAALTLIRVLICIHMPCMHFMFRILICHGSVQASQNLLLLLVLAIDQLHSVQDAFSNPVATKKCFSYARNEFARYLLNLTRQLSIVLCRQPPKMQSQSWQS